MQTKEESKPGPLHRLEEQIEQLVAHVKRVLRRVPVDFYRKVQESEGNTSLHRLKAPFEKLRAANNSFEQLRPAEQLRTGWAAEEFLHAKEVANKKRIAAKRNLEAFIYIYSWELRLQRRATGKEVPMTIENNGGNEFTLRATEAGHIEFVWQPEKINGIHVEELRSSVKGVGTALMETMIYMTECQTVTLTASQLERKNEHITKLEEDLNHLEGDCLEEAKVEIAKLKELPPPMLFYHKLGFKTTSPVVGEWRKYSAAKIDGILQDCASQLSGSEHHGLDLGWKFAEVLKSRDEVFFETNLYPPNKGEKNFRSVLSLNMELDDAQKWLKGRDQRHDQHSG